ncbi:MAG: type 1 glutamine amidotransferase domain-containing protein [Marinifilaceae bacterium]
MKKVLFVLSSHQQFGDTGEKTGWWLSEAAHPWEILHEAGYDIDFVSPQGGQPPVTGIDPNDKTNLRFMDSLVVQEKLKNTLTPVDVKINEYGAILFVGGHGACFDFPDNDGLKKITTRMYEGGRIVAAVCHGPCALLNVKLSDNTFLLKGKQVTGFSDKEECEIKRCYDVPFLLQSEIMLRGGIYQIRQNWERNVCVDGSLITGQNPQSARGVGEAILAQLKANTNRWEQIKDFMS